MHNAHTISSTNPTIEFTYGLKFSAEQKALVWSLAKQSNSITSRTILEQADTVSVTVRHLNRIRREWGCSRKKGRPRTTIAVNQPANPDSLVRMGSNITHFGVHMFGAWMDEQPVFRDVTDLLLGAIQDFVASHPNDSFPLICHGEETLIRLFKALFFAPLFGIGKLIEYDYKENALRTIIGRGYQSSTLNQYLAQLKRIDAGPKLMKALLPTQSNGICYIDGHMIAFWTRTSMHKGKITMLGRIMAGSQAVVAHTEDGYAIWAEYFTPDTRLPQIILEYCERIVSLTGIDLFVIDREVNSVGMASEFTKRGWGLLSMLDRNEYKGLSDWDSELIGQFEGGVEVYQGRFADDRKKDDPRIFSLVVSEGKILPFWGTAKFKETVDVLQWPGVYSRRTEVQENRFKHMINHGALNVNFGIKKIIGPDRHQQRALEALKESSEGLSQKIERKTEKLVDQEAKVSESRTKGHTKRLVQREKCLQEMQADLKTVVDLQEKKEEEIRQAGPVGERGDRDCRKQTVMTMRTLLLENMLLSFMSALMQSLAMPLTLCLDSVLELFFKRGGSCYETPSEFMFFVNMEGLSKQKTEVMNTLIEGINRMCLSRNGKPVRIRPRSRSRP